MSGRLAEASNFDLPPPPARPPLPPATPSAQLTAGVAGQGGGEEEDQSRAGRLEQLRQLLGGSESKISRLAKLDAATRGPGTIETAAAAAAMASAASLGDTTVGRSATNAEGAGGDDVVRIPAGTDKVARARVHRAVQETFPFIKVITSNPTCVVESRATRVPQEDGRNVCRNIRLCKREMAGRKGASWSVRCHQDQSWFTMREYKLYNAVFCLLCENGYANGAGVAGEPVASINGLNGKLVYLCRDMYDTACFVQCSRFRPVSPARQPYVGLGAAPVMTIVVVMDFGCVRA